MSKVSKDLINKQITVKGTVVKVGSPEIALTKNGTNIYHQYFLLKTGSRDTLSVAFFGKKCTYQPYPVETEVVISGALRNKSKCIVPLKTGSGLTERQRQKIKEKHTDYNSFYLEGFTIQKEQDYLTNGLVEKTTKTLPNQEFIVEDGEIIELDENQIQNHEYKTAEPRKSETNEILIDRWVNIEKIEENEQENIEEQTSTSYQKKNYDFFFSNKAETQPETNEEQTSNSHQNNSYSKANETKTQTKTTNSYQKKNYPTNSDKTKTQPETSKKQTSNSYQKKNNYSTSSNKTKTQPETSKKQTSNSYQNNSYSKANETKLYKAPVNTPEARLKNGGNSLSDKISVNKKNINLLITVSPFIIAMGLLGHLIGNGILILLSILIIASSIWYIIYVLYLKNYAEYKYKPSNNPSNSKPKAPKTKSKTSQNKTQPKTKKESSKDLEYKKKVSEYENLFDSEEKLVTELLDKRFEKNTITYDRFDMIIKSCRETFDKELKMINMMIEFGDNDNPQIKEELEEGFDTLKTLADKLDQLRNELVISFNSSETESDEEIELLLDEMENLIDSVKEYK